MWLSFTRPLYLIALPTAGLLLWWSARASFADLSGARKNIAWTLRAIIIISLIFSLAGAQLVKQSKKMVVAFALDDSFSISSKEHTRAQALIRDSLRYARAEDRGALVVFGREALVESEQLQPGNKLLLASHPDSGHTDIGAGLRLALGLLPPESAGRVVLFSDGNENIGSATQEVLLAQARRVPIDIVPLQTRQTRDTLVQSVRLPSQVKREEPFPVGITLEATEPAEVKLTIMVDDKPVDEQTVTVAAGSSALKIPVSISEPGFHEVEVLLDGPNEQIRENNRSSGFVRVKGEPHLLLVDSSPNEGKILADRLVKQDIAVVTAGPAGVPTNTADLERYDAIYLSNLPAYNLTNNQMKMLRDATRDRAIGLGMIGGEYSFGAGGYYRTPIEEALPVDMDVRKDRVYPGAAVLVVMDTSGSMGAIEEGKEKIELAAEAASSIVDLLQPYDMVGVIASDPRPTEICELRKIGNKLSVKRDIRSLRAGGGGIACFPSLSAAYNILKNVKTPIRHVILLADGSDCDEQEGSVPLVAAMAQERMTVTVVAFGKGPHVQFLRNVAEAGRGQFYLTERAADLKKIFTRETLTIAKSVLIEEAFHPKVADATAPISGLEWTKAPPLLGYVATTPKSLAQIPLVSHKDDPVLAHWQYGLGKSVAFTSDAKAHWAAPWLSWSGFSQFWGQTVRWSLRNLSSDVLYPRIEPEGDRARITVDAVAPNGTLLNGLTLRAGLNGPDGKREEVTLSQVAPGRYEASVEAADSGAYIIGLSASGPDGFNAQQTTGFAIGYPPDFAETQTQEAFLRGLAEQTGGRLITDPSQVFMRPAVMPRAPLDIWRSLLWIAAILLPFDIAVRRLVVGRREFSLLAQPFHAAIAGARARKAARTARPETMNRLLARKQALRTRPLEPKMPAAPSPPPETIPPEVASTPQPPTEQSPSETQTTEQLLARKRNRKR